MSRKTYRGPLYEPPPEAMPPSKYKDYLIRQHEQMRDAMKGLGQEINAWGLWEMLKINAQILDEYERIALHE
jgi:hypothetical protein